MREGKERGIFKGGRPGQLKRAGQKKREREKHHNIYHRILFSLSFHNRVVCEKKKDHSGEGENSKTALG